MLFLLSIDWIMRNTTADRPRGIQWTFWNQLEDYDFADDLAVSSRKQKHLHEKTERLHNFAKETGLNINTSKAQITYINTSNDTPITVDGKPLERVEDFANYLGCIVSSDNGAGKDISDRLRKAQLTFAAFRPIWTSKQYSLQTKIRIYNSNVKSVRTAVWFRVLEGLAM